MASKDQRGLLVARVDATLDFFKVAGAEIGVEAAVAEDFVVDLLLREAAAEAELDERADGQAPGAVGTEGAFFDGVAVDLAALGDAPRR